MFEGRGESGVVHSQHGENFADPIARDAPFDGPMNDFQVFLPHSEPINNLLEQRVVGCDGTLQQAKLIRVEFRTEAFPFQMLDPSRSQEKPPVPLLPQPQGELAEIAIRLLAFDPFKFESFVAPLGIEAEALQAIVALVNRRAHFASPTNFHSGSVQNRLRVGIQDSIP